MSTVAAWALVTLGLLCWALYFLTMRRVLKAQRKRRQLPAGMTPSKLRTVADMLDMYDNSVIRTLMSARANGDEWALKVPQERVNLLVGTEMQDDLRKWADMIEGKQ